MDRKCKYLVVLLCLELVPFMEPVRGAAQASLAMNLRVRPPVRTVDTNGYQLTRNAYVGEWLLRIMDEDRFACGAAYYAPLYVLTSASCMHKFKRRLNELSVETLFGNKFALIDTISVPHQYQYPKNFMDIAVIKLVDPIPGDNHEYVKLCSRPIVDYGKLTVVACSSEHKDMRTQQVNLLNQMDCQSQYSHIRLAETIACTHALNQDNECMYDFGCPVTAGDELCGIVAYGPECRNPNLPGLFTDIYQVNKFIRSVVFASKYHHNRAPKQTWFDK
ncbi:uncharacterized protein Dvir_GJ23354 [Drosophila virilis]|uniref:trypsin n=1 Tax=Drosophila virilis TaxID=7244 RepID=B4LYC9_DROVI|nr:uncharacterized protein Dvir_GJ23354 [Drosophila virilis]